MKNLTNALWKKTREDQRGQALAMGAVFMVSMIAMGALAVDLGMAFAARAAAQRAADSAALAGASAFIDIPYTDPDAVDEANARAMEYATANDVLAVPIEESQVSVWVIPDSQKVRVRVAAEELPTWFARMLNVFSMDVAAVAAAVASDGGSADECVLPFAMPDLWDDFDDDTLLPENVPNEGEWWEYDEEDGDIYQPYQGPCTGDPFGCDNGTGLGSNLRNDGTINGDVGRRIWIKSGPKGQGGNGSGNDDDWGAGGTDVMIGPGNFNLWKMPDPENGCVAPNGGGAPWIWENIRDCNSCPISVGTDYDAVDPYDTQTGNVASIKDEMEKIFARDPGAVWDEGSQSIINSSSEDPEQSPRVRIVPIWSVADFEVQGRSTIKFNNMAKIFLEGGAVNPPDFAIYARFLGMVDNGGGGSSTGSLIKYLRLVE